MKYYQYFMYQIVFSLYQIFFSFLFKYFLVKSKIFLRDIKYFQLFLTNLAALVTVVMTSRLAKLQRTVGNILLPVLVMIISVPNSENLSHSSLFSRLHFNSLRVALLLLLLIRELTLGSFLIFSTTSLSTSSLSISSLPTSISSSHTSSCSSLILTSEDMIASMLKFVFLLDCCSCLPPAPANMSMSDSDIGGMRTRTDCRLPRVVMRGAAAVRPGSSGCTIILYLNRSSAAYCPPISGVVRGAQLRQPATDSSHIATPPPPAPPPGAAASVPPAAAPCGRGCGCVVPLTFQLAPASTQRCSLHRMSQLDTVSRYMLSCREHAVDQILSHTRATFLNISSKPF